LNLTIQRRNPPLGILEVKSLVTRDYWLDILDGTTWNVYDYFVLLPKHIAKLIGAAPIAGWNSEKKVKSFVLSTNNGSVFKT